LFFSKLAIIELCGWIEESMDDIVLRCATRLLDEPSNRKYVQNDVVKRNYGFDYEKNFRQMLIKLLGLVNVEHIEAQIDLAKHQAMNAALSNLVIQRNTEAHTHIKGVGKMIDAPSVTLSRLSVVYDGLMEFDRAIRRIKR
jgi:hypothetical protein